MNVVGMSAAAPPRACRKGNAGTAANATMQFGSPPTHSEITIGRSRGMHRRQGRSEGVAAGAAMPTTPPTTENTNITGRSGACHRRSLSGYREGTSCSVTTGGITQTTIEQQRILPPAKSTNNDVGNTSDQSSRMQRLENNNAQVLTHTRSRRYKRDCKCSCDSCTLRSSAAAKITKWEASEAKSNIRDLLLSDRTHKFWTITPGEIYDDNRLLFHLYKFQNFSNNV